MTFELNKRHHGVTYEDYHKAEGLRAGHLREMKRSPAYHKWKQSQPAEEPKDYLEFGKLFHAAIEDPQSAMKRIRVQPQFVGMTKDGRQSTRSKEAQEAKAQWFAELPPDAMVMTAEQQTDFLGMLEALQSHPTASYILKTGEKESSIWVKDPETGLLLKCRPDFISAKGFVVDIKTTRCSATSFFMNEVFRDKPFNRPFYALQAAHYNHCLKILKGSRDDSFIFIAVEKDPPYHVNVFTMDDGCLGVGEQWRRELTIQYAECLATNKWPGSSVDKEYSERAIGLHVPEWAAVPEADDYDPMEDQ